MKPSEQALKYSNQAKEEYQSCEYLKAIQSCDTAIEIDPDCSSAYNNRGTIKLARGLALDALHDFDRAISIQKDNPIFYYNRGLTKEVLTDISCLDDFDRAIEIESDYEDAYIKRGNVKYELNMYHEAIRDYNCAITINSRNHESFYHLGLARLAVNQTQLGLIDLDKSILLNPKFVFSYLGKAEILMETGNKEQAKIYLSLAHKIAPLEPLVYYISSQVLISEKKIDLAINQLIQLADLHVLRREFKYYRKTVRDIENLKSQIKG
jgi:tetratricopeptide (TPR) repeat protein